MIKTLYYSENEATPPKIPYSAILRNVNDLRIESPEMPQPPAFYVMNPYPHSDTIAQLLPQHNPFACTTITNSTITNVSGTPSFTIPSRSTTTTAISAAGTLGNCTTK